VSERVLPELPLRALIPNAITMLALCSGATGVRFAIAGEFEKAAAAIVIAGVLDGIDGRVARLLKGTSRFGAELDSLSDVTAFGIAPALILYLWALEELGRFGWVVALSLAVCCALRLARFNAALDDLELPKKKLGFTTGVPAPVGAGLAMAPMFFSLGTDNSLDADPLLKATIVAVITASTAFLMVSNLPGLSWTSLKVKRETRLFVLAAVGLFAASLAQAPWITLTALSAAYALTIPYAWWRYSQKKAEVLRQQSADSGATPAPGD